MYDLTFASHLPLHKKWLKLYFSLSLLWKKLSCISKTRRHNIRYKWKFAELPFAEEFRA